ncbi:MAG: hypothetical protein ACRDEB_05745, partial [Chitinophagaceae bacterium]
MKINRHNYEEFFILYLDNELNNDDRIMVEEFVLLHPDLKEELDLLLQYKISPDTEIKFRGKEDLLKANGETPVTLTNYEEWFLLYADQELNPAQRKTVENFIAKNPTLQKELALFQQSKLQPELVIYANKETLYRKEEKVRAISFQWRRIAAAVLLLLALSITTVLVINKRRSGKDEVVKSIELRQIPNNENVDISPVTKEITPENKNEVANLSKQIPD